MNDFIEERKKAFISDLKILENDEVIAKYFYHDYDPFGLKNDLYFKLRQKIKKDFSLNSIFDVFMVGSGRLGFSISPRKKLMDFSDNSDIDLVIISKRIFLEYWFNACVYDKALDNWQGTGKAFEDYFFRGWMRPDKIPVKSFKVNTKFDWWEYFETLSSSGEFGHIKINGGLYYSIDFFELYQKESIDSIRRFMEVK